MLKEVVIATAITFSISVAGATMRADVALASDNALLIAQAESATDQQQAQEGTSEAAPATAPAGTSTSGEVSAGAAAEDAESASVTEILEDQQIAHDKYVVDRFLLGVAIVFALIAAALLFSLPPKRREQKE
ncbi:MAG: hypothetical protein K2X93_18935 [Candidatus Obscuribacterales bacterium]|nr:hypothetical protein [Candidatus Obscuribacterales bacterium]